jgi:hypothetical protein
LMEGFPGLLCGGVYFFYGCILEYHCSIYL